MVVIDLGSNKYCITLTQLIFILSGKKEHYYRSSSENNLTKSIYYLTMH